jgi:hypothetical protein
MLVCPDDVSLGDDETISICLFFGLISLLKFSNILLLGFTNSKGKDSSLRKNPQSTLLILGGIDAISAISPFLVLIGSSHHFHNLPMIHICDFSLSITSSFMTKNLLRSPKLTWFGLLSSVVPSSLIFLLSLSLSISLSMTLPHLQSTYQYFLCLCCFIRLFLSLISSCVLITLFSTIADPSFDQRRTLNNYDLTNLGHHRESPAESIIDHQNEEEFESYYQYLFLTVISPVFVKASKSQFFGLDDLPPLSPEMNCHEQINRLSEGLNTLFTELSPSDSFSLSFRIFFLIFSKYSSEFVVTGVLVFFQSLLQFVGPMMLQQLVLSAKQEKSRSKVFAQIIILFLSKFFGSFLDAHSQLLSQNLSLKISGALKGSFFRKATSFSSGSRLKYPIGRLTNLYTIDVDRVADVFKDIHNCWALPLQIIIAMLLLYQIVSYAMFVGFGVFLLIFLLNNVIARQGKLLTDKYG